MTMTMLNLAGRTVKLIEPDRGMVSASVCCPITLRPEWTVYGNTKGEVLEALARELAAQGHE